MRSNRNVWPVSAIVLLSTLCAGGAAGPKRPPDAGRITVTGQGADKDEAVADALAEAARRGVLSVMAGETKTPAYKVARGTIGVAGAAFVENWGVLSGPKTDGGTCKVTLWAVVSERKVKAYCARAKVVMRLKGTPTVLVHVAETLNGKSRQPSSAGARIEGPLVGSGFAVVNATQLDAAKRKRLVTAAGANDTKTLQAIAGELKAQVFVTAAASTSYEGTRRVRGILLHHHVARGGAKCYRSDTARVLVAPSATAEVSAGSAAAAAAQCLQTIGDALSGKIHEKVVRFWHGAIEGFSGVELAVRVLTYRRALDLEKQLKTIQGVSGVTLLSFDAGVAIWSLMGKLTGKDLARELATTMPNMEIEKVTPTAVTGRLKE